MQTSLGPVRKGKNSNVVSYFLNKYVSIYLNEYNIPCHTPKYNSGVKMLMAATHIKNGNDGGVIPTDDVGNIFSLRDLGRYQLWKIEKM